MKNKIKIRVVFFGLIVFLSLNSCNKPNNPTSQKFQIISEIKSNATSPFYVDFKEYPKKRDALPIGVFDSGTGGLAVLDAIFRMDRYNNTTHVSDSDEQPDFQKERFIYLADESNMPYGKYNAEGKADFLRELVIKDVRFLLDQDYYLTPNDSVSQSDKEPVKAIVIACNTATAYGLETVREAIKIWGVDIPVFGIVDAGSKNALELMNPEDADNTLIGVLATEGTCASNGYPSAILLNAEAKLPGLDIPVVQQPGIGLAGAIDGDINYVDPSANSVRNDNDYKGPKLNDPIFPIDTNLWAEYHFDEGNSLLIEKNESGNLIQVQLNSVSNYIKYAVTNLVVNAEEENQEKVMGSVILGCTHYPYVMDEIKDHLKYLKNLNEKYNRLIPENIVLIDPAESLATELYNYLTQKNLWAKNSLSQSDFYISVPNPLLSENQIDKNGEFPYEYKYGRELNSLKQYVKVVPFSDEWIKPEIKERFREVISTTYDIIYEN